MTGLSEVMFPHGLVSSDRSKCQFQYPDSGPVEGMNKKLLTFGIGGTVLAAICCVTPLLPIMLTAVGLTGLIGLVYNDAVLFSAMGIFILITGYALWRQKKA